MYADKLTFNFFLTITARYIFSKRYAIKVANAIPAIPKNLTKIKLSETLTINSNRAAVIIGFEIFSPFSNVCGNNKRLIIINR